MIVVAGTIGFATADARDAAVAATVEHQRATREGEPGCLAYCFAADPVEPTQLQVYELWADEASLAAHFEHTVAITATAIWGGRASQDRRVLEAAKAA